MFPERYVHCGNKVWGQMPSGEIKEFGSPYLYRKTYKSELDEFVDEMYRLECENSLEFPEDYPLEAAYANS